MSLEILRRQARLQAHLTARQFQIRYRRSLLGWLWAFIQPLSRLAIFAFVFTRVIPLGIEDYPSFLFTGIIAWSWFSSGVLSSTSAPLHLSYLLFHPTVHRFTIPVVSVASETMDFLAALPLLWIFTTATTDGSSSVLWFLPVIMVVQFTLMVGLGALLSTAHVYTRDIQRVVEVALSLGFYVTPVFYHPEQIPEGLRWLSDINPMAHIIRAYRLVLLDGRLPDLGEFSWLALACAAVWIAGFYLYGQASRWFVDEL